MATLDRLRLLEPAGAPEKGFWKDPSIGSISYFPGVALNLLQVDLRHLMTKWPISF